MPNDSAARAAAEIQANVPLRQYECAFINCQTCIAERDRYAAIIRRHVQADATIRDSRTVPDATQKAGGRDAEDVIELAIRGMTVLREPALAELFALRDALSAATAERDAAAMRAEGAEFFRDHLQLERDHWKANHDEMVTRNQVLRDRHDLPADRLASYQRLVAERDRLKRGDFTPDELQNLCHNLSDRAEAFFDGCAEYQRKLFGCSDRDRTRAEAFEQCAKICWKMSDELAGRDDMTSEQGMAQACAAAIRAAGRQ